MKIRIFLLNIFIILNINMFAQAGSIKSFKKISSGLNGLGNVLSSYDYFGSGGDTIGDLNNDGITDLIIAAPLDDDGGYNKGAAYILFMDTDKTVKGYQKISSTQGGFNQVFNNEVQFGKNGTGIGDLDGDGNPDVVISSEKYPYTNSTTDNGAIWVCFLRSNGTVKRYQRIDNNTGYLTGGIPYGNGGHFGFDVSKIGDINSDGIMDIAVGQSWASGGGIHKGAIWILMLDTNGKVKNYNQIYDGVTNFNPNISNNNYLGTSVRGIGDIDNDSIPDIAVGSAYYNNTGGVFILRLNANGSVKSYNEISNLTYQNGNPFSGDFGMDITDFPDLNGDGRKDLVVGAHRRNGDYGAYFYLYMSSTFTVDSFDVIDRYNFSQITNGDRFGSSVISMGDINNDGINELAVGAYRDDVGTMTNNGSVFVMSIRSTYNITFSIASTTCHYSSDGSAKAVPTGGTSPYTFLWSTSSTADSIGGLAPGTYSVTVTDATNKTQVRSVTIGSAPSVGLITSNNYTMCNGNWTTLMAVANGGSGSGYAYHWNNGLSNSSSHQVTPTTTTTYTVYASDGNSCHSDTSDIIITVNPVTTPTASGLNIAYCADAAAASLLGSPSGGYFTGSGVSGSGSSGYTFNPANANTGQVDVIYHYTNSYGCVGRDTISTTVYPIPTIQFSGINSSYCQNNADVTLSATPTGGSFSINNTGATIFSPTTLGLGTYKIKYNVTSTAGCSNSDSIITYVNPVTTATLSGLAAAYCANSSSTTLLGSPAGGSFLPATGLSGSSYNPSVAGLGQHTISYKYTNAFNCTDTASQTTTVNPTTPLTITTPKTMFCNDDAVATISVTPTGGTLTGQGVNNTNKTFNPVTAGLGSKTVIYTFTNPYGCTTTDSLQLTVNSPATMTISGLASSYCANGESVNITGYPTGGSFSGAGISGNTFNPILAGTGTKVVSYIYNNGCVDTLEQNVTIHGLPTVTFTGLSNSYCEDNNAVTLSGSPANGTFYGSGISGTSFNPSNAGTGIQTISYISPLDANGCKDTATNQTTIHSLPTITFGSMTMDQCISTNSVSLSANPTGGTFTGNAVSGNTFNPTTAGLGTKRIYYSYTDGNSCSAIDSFAFVVHNLPTINFSVGQSCANINAMTLSATPSGGSFSGANVTGSIFNPTAAGVGSHQVIYNYTDGYGCTNSDTEQVVVNALPNLNFSISQNNLCINGSPISLTATPTGGSFSGTAVTNASFNPTTAGIGSHDIIYTYTDANLCSNTDTASVVVHALPSITFGSMSADQCINTNAVALSATPAGGNFLGTAVTGSSFNPSQAGVGQSKIYYSYADSYNCSNTDSITITVHSLPTINFSVGQSCANINAMTLSATPNGGSFSGANVTGTTFNATAAGVGLHQVIYNYTDGYGCSNSDTEQVVVNALPNLNFSISQNNLCVNGAPISLTATPTGGSFSGTAVNNANFNPTTAGAGSHDIIYTYTDANLCTNQDTETVVVHALPTISLTSTNSNYCMSNTPDTLIASPQGGTFTGAGVIGNLFITSIAGVGQHWIHYNYSSSYGCSNSDSIQVNIFPAPTTSFSGLSLNYCINDEPDTLIATPIGGTFSGSGISNNIFNPQTAGLGSHLVYYHFTDTNNCSAQVIQSTLINGLPMADAGEDTLIPCNTMGLQIGQNPQTGLSYFWQPATGLNNVNQANPTANPQSTTTYIFTVNNITTHCKNYDTITVSLPNGPQISLSPDTAICLNDTAHLWVSGGNKWSWSGGDTTSQILVSPSDTTIYHITAYNSMMCSTQDSVLVVVNPLPKPHLFTDTLHLNYPDSMFLSVGLFDTYLWSTGDTASSIFIIGGDYTINVWVTDSNGCRGKDSMFVYQESINEIIPGVSVKLYPNPTNNYAHVKFSKAIALKGYELFDGLGRKVSNIKIQGITLEFKIDVSSLPKGSYYLRLIFDEKTKTLPIFVQ